MAPVQDTSGVAGGTERRRRPELRELFDSAYRLIEPFFDPQSGWAGRSLEHLAFRVLRENFPALSAEDVHVVIAAAHRVYITAHPAGSDHLRRPEELRPRR
ncbi:MAG TPA: hypothetical protein PKD04_00520 [Rhodocyclaceae bacterium]|jgi:hypothetical protein|nr:hypothetical protein [Betaproteobacteria bacterium]HMU99529.1 hypothetical protein [Rhodocyclaceae bacterium]HMV20236.1 hypothetical protein [Rhodocyclaceae bacterium]HNE42860.1 hypothetical protein [Rhodocyclaceae bacterium]HNL21110.1 hypothetical protein [Rhodocyclaceae bacterium]